MRNDLQPTRKFQRLANWPEAGRLAWNDLFADGDILEHAGPARHWRPATRRTNLQHYARWLGWHAHRGELDPASTPATRVTPERVLAYAAHLVETLAPCTAASAVIGLKVLMKAMAPETDWRWLIDLSNRLNTWARPAVDRTPAMRRSTRFTAPPGRSSTGFSPRRFAGASTGSPTATR